MQMDDPETSNTKASFLHTLISNTQTDSFANASQFIHADIDLSDEIINCDRNEESFIPLTASDKSRLYSSWQYSVIVKVFGKKVGHQLLRSKITTLWKSTEELPPN